MHSFSRIASAQPHYLRGQIISVEVDISRGLHSFSIVGLPDKAVEEARDRVSSALKNTGFPSPKSENHKIVVSLAPADIKKEGSYFDVAIAVAYLEASHTRKLHLDGKLFIGELSLDGIVRKVPGVLPLAQAAKAAGYTELYVPKENALEASLVDGIEIYPMTKLIELVDHLDPDKAEKIDMFQEVFRGAEGAPEPTHCFSTVRGQESAKRALEIAAAGGHNIALSGPPGTGKMMLARAFSGILPPLSRDAMLEITGIHSIAGTLGDQIVIHSPPFRSPHHTASYVSLIGGGATPRPGEVTLAHHGVLFMDEFPEFDTRVLKSLRQPLEDRIVTISRAKGSATFPASFCLVAAMNPCPCGNRGATHKQCRCAPGTLARYERKLSGPIMDGIDIHVVVEHIDYEKLSDGTPTGEQSEDIRKRVVAARERQRARFESSTRTNAHMKAYDLKNLSIAEPVWQTLNQSARALSLSQRAYHRTIKLAQTIADLDESDSITDSHILEALQYRPKSSY